MKSTVLILRQPLALVLPGARGYLPEYSAKVLQVIWLGAHGWIVFPPAVNDNGGAAA